MKAWSRGLYFSLAASAAFAVWFKYNIVEWRKQQIKEFYETYDSQKTFEAQKAAGIFKGFEPN